MAGGGVHGHEGCGGQRAVSTAVCEPGVASAFRVTIPRACFQNGLQGGWAGPSARQRTSRGSRTSKDAPRDLRVHLGQGNLKTRPENIAQKQGSPRSRGRSPALLTPEFRLLGCGRAASGRRAAAAGESGADGPAMRQRPRCRFAPTRLRRFLNRCSGELADDYSVGQRACLFDRPVRQAQGGERSRTTLDPELAEGLAPKPRPQAGCLPWPAPTDGCVGLKCWSGFMPRLSAESRRITAPQSEPGSATPATIEAGGRETKRVGMGCNVML